jgi:hypothetical protein
MTVPRNDGWSRSGCRSGAPGQPGSGVGEAEAERIRALRDPRQHPFVRLHERVRRGNLARAQDPPDRLAHVGKIADDQGNAGWDPVEESKPELELVEPRRLARESTTVAIVGAVKEPEEEVDRHHAGRLRLDRLLDGPASDDRRLEEEEARPEIDRRWGRLERPADRGRQRHRERAELGS